MDMQHWALPIVSTDGRLLGVELETRVEVNGCRVLTNYAMRDETLGRRIFEEQAGWLDRKAGWFIDNGLFCIVSSEVRALAQELPFIKFFSNHSRERPETGFWIDKMGAFNSSAIPVFTQGCEVVRFNKHYATLNISRPIFPVLINNIRRYCDKVIVPVHNRRHFAMLDQAGVWAVQQECSPVHFSHCESLLDGNEFPHCSR